MQWFSLCSLFNFLTSRLSYSFWLMPGWRILKNDLGCVWDSIAYTTLRSCDAHWGKHRNQPQDTNRIPFLFAVPEPCFYQKAVRACFHGPGMLECSCHTGSGFALLHTVMLMPVKAMGELPLGLIWWSDFLLSTPSLHPSSFSVPLFLLLLLFFLWCMFLALTGQTEWQRWRLKSSIYTQSKHKIGKRLRKWTWTAHPEILWP